MDILELVDRGARTVGSLNQADRLRCVAMAFLDVFREFDDFGVVAASPQAERVLGAAMMIHPGLQGGGFARTVILDLNIASGTLLARAARRIRETGNNEQLVGVVMYTLCDFNDTLSVPGLSRIIIANNALEIPPTLPEGVSSRQLQRLA